MAVDPLYSPFYQEIKAFLLAAAQITTVAFITEDEAAYSNFVQELQKGFYSTPLWVVSIGEFTNDPDWGLGNRFKRAPTTIWLLDKRVDGNTMTMQETVAGQVEIVGTMIDTDNNPAATGGATGFQTFRSVEFCDLDSSAGNVWNSRMSAGTLPYIGASVSWSPGLLTGESQPLQPPGP